MTAALLAGVAPAQAQLVCLDHVDMAAALESQYNETVVAVGITTKEKNMLEVFAAPSGSWTIVITKPPDYACIVAFGQGMQLFPIRPTKTGFQT